MAESKSDINILIAKSVSGNITPEENAELEKWKSASDANQSLYIKTKTAWEKSTNFISEQDLEEDRIKVQNEIIRKLQNRIAKSRRLNLLFKAAAAIAIPLTFALSWYLLNTSNNLPVKNQITEITSPKGNISKCVLPDGTEVWINTASTISYDANSFNTAFRDISLSGEAYFEVSKNEEKPFRVNTKLGCVCVTGTAFNVKAYSESEIFETVLTEGSVTLKLNSGTQQTVNLIPGEKAIFDSKANKVHLSKVQTELFSSWRNGEIIFKDATLNDLIKELERIYDIKFYLNDVKLGEYRFRGMFSYNNNLIDALEKIKKTARLDYYIENKEVTLTKIKER